MARQVRIEYEGATYHVMCRGDRREAVFADDRDRETFLRTLAEVVNRTGWRVHAYVLMGNHYHLLLETPAANLVRGMTWFQTTYTARYNARHRTSGHLFGGRYKAIVVEADDSSYLATLLDYIHLNPVRAGLIPAGEPLGLLGYRWSSLPGYARSEGRAPWLRVEQGLGAFGWQDGAADRRAFVARLEARVFAEHSENCGVSECEGQSPRSSLRRGWYFGREAFREWLLEKAGGVLGERQRSGQNYHGAEMRDHGEAEASRLIRAGLEENGLTMEALRRLPKSDERKVKIARTVRAQTTVPLRWLAEKLSLGSAMNASRVTTAKQTAKIFS